MTRYLVIGGAGYIGSHMVKTLAERGDEVVVLDNLSTGHRQAIRGGTLVEGDARDSSLLRTVFESHVFDCVIHFAASSLVGESVERPLEYYTNNVGGALAVVETMRLFDVERIILSSTAAVYGTPQRLPIEESDELRPASPYGRSKLFVEQVLRDCGAAYGLRFVALRYFNACGADLSG